MILIRKLIKILAAFVLFPAAVFFSIYSLEQQGFFKVDHLGIDVDVEANQKNYIGYQVELLEKKLASVKGISLWKAPLSQISKSLKQENWIKEFQISRAWPSGIELQIEPDPVAFLVLAAEKNSFSSVEATTFQPVTEGGRVLDSVKSSVAPNTMVTHDTVFLTNETVRNGAINVIKSLPKSGSLSASHVSEIGYDRKEGYWLKLLQSETKVNFGEEQFEIKSARISQVIDYLENRNLKARVIDANLSKKVLVRLQQNP